MKSYLLIKELNNIKWFTFEADLIDRKRLEKENKLILEWINEKNIRECITWVIFDP